MRIENRFGEYIKRRFGEVLFASFIIFGIGYITYNTLIPYFFTKEEKKVYFESQRKLNNPNWLKTAGYKNIAKEMSKVEQIESKYALYRALPFINFRAFLVALISFLLPTFAFIAFSLYWLKKKQNFFFNVAKKEQPLELGRPMRLLLFKDLKAKGVLNLTEREFVKLVFDGDYKSYAKVMAFMNGEIIETGKIKFPLLKINKRIEEITNDMVRWGYATFKLTSSQDEKLFRACLYLSLLHYIANLYGNIPVSFLSPFIKNPVVNDFKSFYYYKKLPVKLGKVRDFLTIFHTYPVDILESLRKEFTPLSFEKHDDLYFREEFFQNALSDYEEAKKYTQKLESELNREEKIFSQILTAIKGNKNQPSVIIKFLKRFFKRN